MALVLAPVGSKEALLTALSSGADGFYMGGRGWSRWGRTSEVSEEEMAQCIRLGLSRGCQIQIVFNRIPTHGEEARFLAAVEASIRQGAHEVILNDLGAISLVRQHLPEVNVGVSIGCSIRNLEDARFYADLGVSTLVLPWTMSAEDVYRLKEEYPHLRLEIFLYVEAHPYVLGLCTFGSYTHMKQVETEPGVVRYLGSAKRCGNCSRPCTRPWETQVLGRTIHEGPMPRRHIVVLDTLAEMIVAGVDLLKVQGRNLPPEKVGGLIGALKTFVVQAKETVEGRPELPGDLLLDWDAGQMEVLTELLPQAEFI